jgi:hypothetical protein
VFSMPFTTFTMTNTIVAGNTPNDIEGPPDSGSTNNLVGGVPLLAPLGDYGGPTPTMALLPGSPAIGGGTANGAPATDQRGQPRSGRIDIGAFQSQGFVLATVSGSTPQSAVDGKAFANPLAVMVTASNPLEPVDGGIISFAVPAGGASATLSATTAVIASGKAGVTATANATSGAYTVTASAAGAGSALFAMTNTDPPSLVVDTTSDEVNDTDGLTSLREALAYANSLPGTNTITFDRSVFGTTAQTIALSTSLGELTLSDTAGTTIEGPGANLLTVSGGGATRVFDVEGGSLALLGLTVSGGKADNGGGLYNNRGTVALTNVTVSGNTASGDGGGLFNCSYGNLSLNDCTVSGNTAGFAGGGLYTQPIGTLALTNVTVSGNTAGLPGGGMFIGGGTSTLSNCTVSGNSAGSTGGGLYVFDTPTLTNTIVAGQTTGGDVHGALNAASANNLVGDGSGMTGISDGSQGNQVGTPETPINPLLAALGNYGGPTQTMALLPGSPAIGGGTAAGAPPTDQRGQLRKRPVDIGAFQSQGFEITPVAGSTPQSAALGQGFGKPLVVSVTANNSLEPVDGGVISFAAPAAGVSATLSAATAVIARGQAGAEASVTASANGVAGSYAVTASATGAGSISFSLTNTAASRLVRKPPQNAVQVFDDLASLRAAVAYANNHPGPDVITFDPAVFGTRPRTIRLVGGPLMLTDPATTTIIGPGARLLTISGGRKSRVFDIEGGSLALSGVTIADGTANRGGGLLNEDGRLVLTDVVVRGNRAFVGGGLYNDGRTMLSAVSIKGNRAHVGSGMFNTRTATLLWRRSRAAIRQTTRVHHTERDSTA